MSIYQSGPYGQAAALLFFCCVLTEIEIENKMVEEVVDAANSGFPLTKRQLLIKVGLIAKKMNFKTQFKQNLPSEEYWRSLKRRHPELTIRSPEPCGTNMMQGVDRFLSTIISMTWSSSRLNMTLFPSPRLSGMPMKLAFSFRQVHHRSS